MKIINTFYYDNEGNVIKSDCKAIVYGKVFDCDLYNHFSRFAYLNTTVEKRLSYKYVGCTEIKEANLQTYINEA